ncbi:hypothetical protein JW905_17100 [bacterium]|nr:hypothetical protein [candidate division CSSED10-310 bacterium]
MIGIWLLLVHWLMIADVWDETNGLLFFEQFRLAELLPVIWTVPLFGLYRPLAMSAAVLISKAAPTYGAAWLLLRWCNAGMLLAGLMILASLLADRGRRQRSNLLWLLPFSAPFLLSAGWGAAIFDTSALLLICAGLHLLHRRWWLSAGLLLGLAWFCKEAAVLALPVAILMTGSPHRTSSSMVRAATAWILPVSLFSIMRCVLIPPGSAVDLHGFQPEFGWSTAASWLRSMWFGDLVTDPAIVIGLALTAASPFLLRGRCPRLALVTLIIMCIPLYWGMLDHHSGCLIQPSHFSGRLFLLPVTLGFFIILLHGRRFAPVFVLVPLLLGGALFAIRHHRFQNSYAQVYLLPLPVAPDLLRIRSTAPPLVDHRRRIAIGEYPDAEYLLRVEDGRLLTVSDQ